MLPTAHRIASHLSITQRQCLISHCCGPQPFLRYADDLQRKNIVRTKMALVAMKLLCPPQNSTIRPRDLRLTYLGREVVCIVLGEIADAMMANGDPLTAGQAFVAIEKTRLLKRGKPPCDPTTISPAAAAQAETPAQSMIRSKETSDLLLRRLCEAARSSLTP